MNLDLVRRLTPNSLGQRWRPAAAAFCLVLALAAAAWADPAAAQTAPTPSPTMYVPTCTTGYGSGYVSGCGYPVPSVTPNRTPIRTATPTTYVPTCTSAYGSGYVSGCGYPVPSLTPTRTATATASGTPARTATPVPGATSTPAATATRPLHTPTVTPTVPPFVLVGRPLEGLTVALDPGHGGRDPGALYHGLHESNVNLAIAQLARPLLEQAGAQVVLTRDRDVMVGPADGSITQDLQARAQVANRAGAHVFVSIHANVHSDGEVSGAVTFYGAGSGYAGGQRRSPRQVALSALLAETVQRGVVARTGEVDRGLHPAVFWVLGATNMPSILLESGFLTNTREAANLGRPEYQRRLAEGITAGLIEYVRRREELPTRYTDPAPAVTGHPSVRYYEATGHNLAFGFRHFFDTHGGLDIFGYPRTEEIQENGFTVQYFQRARFEYHPEHAGTPYEVQLGLLGDAVTAPRQPFPPGGPFASDGQHRWYPETGHGVHFAFLRYFDERGGLDVFGYPVSEELYGENGWPYAVQYFQRARFEYHPEHAGTPYEVQLGLLGDQLLQQRGWLR